MIRSGTPRTDADGRTTRHSLTTQVWDARWCYVFMVPSLILAGLFTFYPVIASWYISFLDWSGLTADRAFVGIENYQEASADPFFWRAFRRTFLFAFVAVPVMLLLSLILAIVLNDPFLRLRSMFRTMFFLPVVTTTAIVGIVMSLIMNPFDGPLNTALLTLRVIDRPINFLGDPDLALWSMAGIYVWKWFGVSMIYWLVALQTVPAELYEAAKVDGAKTFQLHRSITAPLILPFAILITLITFVGSLSVFPLIQATTGGGPAFSTELIELYIYRLAFAAGGQPRLGYASAVAVLFGVITLALTLFQAWGARKANAARSQMESET